MKLSVLATFLPLALASVIPRADRGHYAVPGLGQRKQELLKAGANTMDMAIAMLETENMGTDYKFGDGKTGDATNYGIFKQNWMMLRQSASEFKNMTAEQVDKGIILNKDLAKDIKARHDSEKFFGFDKWCGGHRNGETGLGNPNTADIHNYMNGITWIQKQIESDKKFQSDDTRFYVDVVAI